jgi:hypothetical protein
MGLRLLRLFSVHLLVTVFKFGSVLALYAVLAAPTFDPKASVLYFLASVGFQSLRSLPWLSHKSNQEFLEF